MSEFVKPIGTEQYCNTVANTFGGNRFVRVTNINTSPWLITRANSSGTIGTFTILPNQSVTVEKYFTETLASNTASNFVVASPVAKKD
jgi:hypothetical protein